MGGDLARIGTYAVASWASHDVAIETRLDQTAHIMSRAVAALDASGKFPRLTDALDEAVRQFEHGSIALLMNLTPLAADAARRVLEVVFFTTFMRLDPTRLAAWHAGAEEFRFTGPLKQYFTGAGAAVANGPYGQSATLDLYKRLSASVHANPMIWSESRDGLKIEAAPSTTTDREVMLHDAARCVIYVILHQLPDLEIDGIEELFPLNWTSVRSALGL
jgi:hypothetical protein